jgi:hypothetical protein
MSWTATKAAVRIKKAVDGYPPTPVITSDLIEVSEGNHDALGDRSTDARF